MLAGFFSGYSRVKLDSVLGVVFSGMFALGLVLPLKISTDVHLDHILFGNILGIAFSDLFVSGFISLLVFCIIILKRRDLMLHSFDPIQAPLVGKRSGLLHYGLLIMISLTVVSSLASVGILLSIGILIAPGKGAFLITRRFPSYVDSAC
jgi:ABC-type Mn2+/Zn2+ transport systems, permease components